MADRYQDRPFAADDDYDRGGHQTPSKSETDPLAELARLIGQADPFAGFGRANQPLQPRGSQRVDEPEPAFEAEDDAPAGPPPWMQRAAAQELPQQEFEPGLHPVQRYAAAHPAEPDYDPAPPFAAAAEPHEPDPERYDDALYGQLPSAPGLPPEPGYDDPYAYQDDYAAGTDDQPQKSRRGAMIMVAAVLALAVVGTGGAFAYRTYVGSSRSGEPPIIKADAGPNKVMAPQAGDASGKPIQDRMGGPEKLVSREEAPVDPKDGKAGPRVVFPPLNQNANPPLPASVAPGNRPPSIPGNGNLGGDEPRKIRTFTVRGDQPDPAATPVTKPAPAARAAAPAVAAPPRSPPPATANANASTANAPLSLTPQSAAPQAEPRSRVATNTSAPQPITPAAAAASSSGGYMVQISSQRNEADAQASFRSLQGKFPAVLGSRAPLIKRADLGEKGVYYRAMVGPFGSPDEAKQFCGNLKTAGGQCVVQGN